MSIFAFICVAIYIVSFIAHIILLWREEGKYFYKIRDVVDSIDFYIWCPILNTLFLILFAIVHIAHFLYKLLKLDVAWDWLMNIKLK